MCVRAGSGQPAQTVDVELAVVRDALWLPPAGRAVRPARPRRPRTAALPADRWSPITETLLMYAARRDHIERVIRPALEPISSPGIIAARPR